MTLQLELAPEFGWAVIVAVLVGFECLLIGFLCPGRLRNRIFNKEYLEKHFKGAARGGYPDMGCGRYAAKLSEQEWLLFNNAQRAHYNFVEGVATYIVMILAGAVYFPSLATGLGCLIIVGRILFAYGYMASGPTGRLVGALMVDFAVLGLLFISVISGWNIATSISNKN